MQIAKQKHQMTNQVPLYNGTEHSCLLECDQRRLFKASSPEFTSLSRGESCVLEILVEAIALLLHISKCLLWRVVLEEV